MMQTASFAAGCFWGVEEIFREHPGVIDAAVGYMGGTTLNPTYDDVCTGTTGHAETLQIQYDPEKISYDQLLTIFWENHNPTQLNRQGPDIGTQYRSVIFYHTSAQQITAEASKMTLEKSGKYTTPIVTEIIPASTFWRAEEYHQQYNKKNGRSCHV